MIRLYAIGSDFGQTTYGTYGPSVGESNRKPRYERVVGTPRCSHGLAYRNRELLANNISRKVDYLVCGMQDAGVVKDGVHSTKMLSAAEANAKGGHIELLSEADFYQMLHS